MRRTRLSVDVPNASGGWLARNSARLHIVTLTPTFTLPPQRPPRACVHIMEPVDVYRNFISEHNLLAQDVGVFINRPPPPNDDISATAADLRARVTSLLVRAERVCIRL